MVNSAVSYRASIWPSLLEVYHRLFVSLLIFALLVCVFFDPSDQIVGFKTPAFLACFLAMSFKLTLSKVKLKLLLFVVFIALMLPISMFCVGVIREKNWDLVWAINTAKSHVFFLSLLIFLGHRDFVIKAYIFLCLMLALAIISIFLGLLMGSQFFSGLAYWLSFDVEAAMIGMRDYGGHIFYMIYYKTSVLLIVGVGLLTKVDSNKRLFLFCVFMLALFLSGTRANIIAGFFMSLVYLSSYGFKSFQARMLGASLMMPIIFFIGYVILERFFDPAEVSNSIKQQHFLSYIKAFGADPLALLLGQGLGSGFESIYHQGIVYETELTFFELLRRGGWFSALTLLLVLIYPVVKERAPLGRASFLAFALVVMTNPLLFSSTGMTALAVAYLVIINSGSRYANK